MHENIALQIAATGGAEWEVAGLICTDVLRRQTTLGVREEICGGILPQRAFVNVPPLQGSVKFS